MNKKNKVIIIIILLIFILMIFLYISMINLNKDEVDYNINNEKEYLDNISYIYDGSTGFYTIYDSSGTEIDVTRDRDEIFIYDIDENYKSNKVYSDLSEDYDDSSNELENDFEEVE